MSRTRQQAVQTLVRCVAAFSGIFAACSNNNTPVCLSGGESAVEASEKDLVDFSLDEVIEGLSPLEVEAAWQRGEFVPDGVAGTTTRLRVELAVASNTRVTQVAQRHEDPSDEMICGDHLQANIALKWKTDDGALDESSDADLTAFGVGDSVSVSGELPPEMLSGNLQLSGVDSVSFNLRQVDGSVGGAVSASILAAEADEGLAPIGRIETLLSWDEGE
jgi:hypothetical protein